MGQQQAVTLHRRAERASVKPFSFYLDLGFYLLLPPESQGCHLDLTVVSVPNWLDSGLLEHLPFVEERCGGV